MTVSTSAVAICNKALDLLGQKGEVTNIETPRTEQEIIFARHYDDTRQMVLRKYVWNFATERKRINRDALNSPDFDYTDAYKLPNDFIRLLSFDDYQSLCEVEYELSGGYLLLNNNGAASIRLRYIKDVTDVHKFDAGFKYLFSLYLAAAVAYKFSQKQTVLQRIYELIGVEEAKIISIDGQERPPRRVQRSKYLNARKRLGSSNSASPWI